MGRWLTKWVWLLFSSPSGTFKMSNWSLKVRSGLGLCWFKKAEHKFRSEQWPVQLYFIFYKTVSIFFRAFKKNKINNDRSFMVQLMVTFWRSQMLLLDLSTVCTVDNWLCLYFAPWTDMQRAVPCTAMSLFTPSVPTRYYSLQPPDQFKSSSDSLSNHSHSSSSSGKSPQSPILYT